MNKTITWWHAIVLTFVFNILTGLLIFGIGRAASGSDSVKKQIEQKADVVYVKEQDLQLNAKIDTKVSKDEFNILFDMIKSIQTDTREIRQYTFKNK
jgi:hypothetical protein